MLIRIRIITITRTIITIMIRVLPMIRIKNNNSTKLRKAMKPNTKLVFSETPANPVLPGPRHFLECSDAGCYQKSP